jgi:CheY-like chemotaxis protein
MVGRRKTSENFSESLTPRSRTPSRTGPQRSDPRPPPSTGPKLGGTGYSIVTGREGRDPKRPAARSERPRKTSGVYESTAEAAPPPSKDLQLKDSPPTSRRPVIPREEDEQVAATSAPAKEEPRAPDPPPPPVSRTRTPPTTAERKPTPIRRVSMPKTPAPIRKPSSRAVEMREVPTPPPASSPVSSRARPSSPPPITAAALLVTDDAGIRETLGRVLRTSGVEALVCATTDRAAALLEGTSKSKPAVLIFVDVMLKGLDGPQFVERMRSHAKASSARVILVSALSATALTTMSVEWGADGSLPTTRGLLYTETAIRAWLAANQ